MPQGPADDAFLQQANHLLHERFDFTHLPLPVMNVAISRACVAPDPTQHVGHEH